MNILVILSGVIYYINPYGLGIELASDIIAANKQMFAVIWTFVSLISLGLSVISIKRGLVLKIAISVTVALGSTCYAALTFSNGYWDRSIYSVVLASFAIIFPFWQRFEGIAASERA